MLHHLLDVSQVIPVISKKRPQDRQAYIDAFVTQKCLSKKKSTLLPAITLAADLAFQANFTLEVVDIAISDDIVWTVDHTDDTTIYKFVVRSKSVREDMLTALCQAVLLGKERAVVCYLAQGEYRSLDNDYSVDSDTILSWLLQEHEWRQRYSDGDDSVTDDVIDVADDYDHDHDTDDDDDDIHVRMAAVSLAGGGKTSSNTATSNVSCRPRQPVMFNSRMGMAVEKNGPYPDEPAPIQIFLCRPNADGLNESLSIPNNLPRYRTWVHAPYSINLSHAASGGGATSSGRALLKQLLVCAKAGIKGCVVHVGKAKELDLQTAYSNMRQQLVEVMLALHKRVPLAELRPYLLVETGAGQGTEICCHPLILKQMIEEVITEVQSSLDSTAIDNQQLVTQTTTAETTSTETTAAIDSNQVKLGICLDSCHVFAAGFCPLWSLQQLQPYVKLIHYNDSRKKFGSCVDRHERAGIGYIGYEVMYELWHQAQDLDIPCVME